MIIFKQEMNWSFDGVPVDWWSSRGSGKACSQWSQWRWGQPAARCSAPSGPSTGRAAGRRPRAGSLISLPCRSNLCLNLVYNWEALYNCICLLLRRLCTVYVHVTVLRAHFTRLLGDYKHRKEAVNSSVTRLILKRKDRLLMTKS